MSGKRTSSFLQLQLGQEVIYLLLSLFGLLVLVLAFFVSSQRSEIQAAEGESEKMRGFIGIIEGKLGDADKKNQALAELVRKQKAEIDRLRDQLAKLERETAEAKEKARKSLGNIEILISSNKDLQGKIEILSAQLTDKPPIINLSEARGYTFRVGENVLSPEFQKKLTDTIIPELLKAGDTYRADVIEVIGHTDEQRVPERFSNLDTRLLGFLQGDTQQAGLIVGDNTGLGMSRAAAVARHLMFDPRIRGKYTVLPLSAGQAVETGDKLSAGGNEKDVAERRRIEIRVRRR